MLKQGNQDITTASSNNNSTMNPNPMMILNNNLNNGLLIFVCTSTLFLVIGMFYKLFRSSNRERVIKPINIRYKHRRDDSDVFGSKLPTTINELKTFNKFDPLQQHKPCPIEQKPKHVINDNEFCYQQTERNVPLRDNRQRNLNSSLNKAVVKATSSDGSDSSLDLRKPKKIRFLSDVAENLDMISKQLSESSISKNSEKDKAAVKTTTHLGKVESEALVTDTSLGKSTTIDTYSENNNFSSDDESQYSAASDVKHSSNKHDQKVRKLNF